MDRKRYDKAISELDKANLGKFLDDDVMPHAEDAWKEQEQSIRSIDLKNDEIEGETSLDNLADALNLWIISLEVLSDAAKKVAKRAHQAVHTGGSHEDFEENGERYGNDRISNRADRVNGEKGAVQC